MKEIEINPIFYIIIAIYMLYRVGIKDFIQHQKH